MTKKCLKFECINCDNIFYTSDYKSQVYKEDAHAEPEIRIYKRCSECDWANYKQYSISDLFDMLMELID